MRPATTFQSPPPKDTGPAQDGSYAVPQLLDSWLSSSFVLKEDWDHLTDDQRGEVLNTKTEAELRKQLVKHHLLTEYQAGRLEAGTTFGMVLGGYRVLDRLGAGGMGIVFLAEHIRMRRQVAIKVLHMHPDQDQRLLNRFLCEIRTIARLQHPNIVWAMDAGECPATERGGSVLHYFVMEYVPGRDLEDIVRNQGPLPFAKTCDFIHQIASALAEANKHHLVHRDLKPSNIHVTPEGQAKLLDFGLARNFRFQSTEPGTILGTLDYMAPEQIQDAHHVDIRADIYGLGGVMYWCLTGEPPFVLQGSLMQEVGRRLSLPPPSVLAKRADVPPEIDTIVQRMMAVRPEERYSAPEQVMKALLPFLRGEAQDCLLAAGPVSTSRHNLSIGQAPRVQQVLLVDDEDGIRSFARMVLQSEGLSCDEARNGREAIDKVVRKNYDLVLLDVNMPDMDGMEVCKHLRDHPPYPNLKIVMASGGVHADVLAQILLSGADDFLTKPFSVVQLRARVKAALRLKQAQDRADSLNQHLQTANQELEKTLTARDQTLVESRSALVLALARLVDHRVGNTGGHLHRMQQYCRVLAEEAAAHVPILSKQLTPTFVELLCCAAPLHDIGTIGLPDHILLKPGKLDSDERLQMQSHTILGAETLQEVARKHGSSLAFLQMAVAIIRHHHERYDGAGYPDRLAGTDIPLEARLVAIADVYDALRRRTSYKSSLSHHAATQIILESSQGQFDPVLLGVFQKVSSQFEKIHREMPGN